MPKVTLPIIMKQLEDAVKKIDAITSSTQNLPNKTDLTNATKDLSKKTDLTQIENATKADGTLDKLIGTKSTELSNKIDAITKQGGDLNKTYVAVETLTKKGGTFETLIGTHDSKDPNNDTGLYKVIHDNFTELMG